ncbi:monofunctional biosynthetic peptidoglycan transglycosylase [Terricaulis sp.]|uniref:monofunctional biosynthetic peptidoglycan transglycosylase n=1 Tax=Terricaulis sp. TaxID=2768686 RepID=UPI003784EAA7
MNPDEDSEQGKPEAPAPQAAPEPAPPEASASAPEPEAPPTPEPEPLYEPAPQAPRFETRRGESVFGEPDIPMPGERPSMSRKLHARDAQKNLDLDLKRIKRTKRYGVLLTTITVLFVAFVVTPVTWSAIYLFADPPTNVLMLKRAAEGETIRHYPISIDDMSPNIIRAVIAAEDGNFCTHDGFDVAAIQNAMQSNARGRRVRGGSTVSQQTAKNLFLWPERSWIRKGFETYFTALIEFMWPKERIMEAYLNAAEWGDGNFGVEAAARARFNTSAKDLTPRQAALLAAVLPSPNRWRADAPGPYVRRRAATIAQRAAVVRNEHMAACVLALDRPRERR